MADGSNSAAITDDDLDGLRGALEGDALVSGDSAWDAGRQAWNLIAEQDPALIVHAESAADVAATMTFARDHDLRVAPQSTGHGAAPMPDLGGAILLRTSRMASVSIDPGAQVATIGAGAKWADVLGPAAEHGLAALHGSSGTVGVAGYTLSGGLGWLARSRGFACNSVRGMEAVTADGEIRRVDADTDPDLFWALRGGGGTHAVVTSFDHGLVEMREAFAGSLMWPIERAREISQAWREWVAGAPDELSATQKLVRFPPFPQVPDPLRGRALVAITFVYAGDAAEGEDLLAPIRALGEPYLEHVDTVPAPALGSLAGDPEDPVPGGGAGYLLETLDEDAIDAYVEIAGPDTDVPLIHLELRRLGGALDRSDPAHGALDIAGADYLLYGVGAVMSPEVGEAIKALFSRIEERMAPWTADHALLAFAEQRPDLSSCFPAATAERLERLKSERDPDGLILANHGDG